MLSKFDTWCIRISKILCYIIPVIIMSCGTFIGLTEFYGFGVCLIVISLLLMLLNIYLNEHIESYFERRAHARERREEYRNIKIQADSISKFIESYNESKRM